MRNRPFVSITAATARPDGTGAGGIVSAITLATKTTKTP
jgi:hypothetical protein